MNKISNAVPGKTVTVNCEKDMVNDKNRQTILLISDMRQVYLAEILTKKGFGVRCLDVRNTENASEQMEKLKGFLTGADMLILPIPVSKVPRQEQLNEILNQNLINDTLVLGGCFSSEQQELLKRRGIHYLDFMEDKIVTEENAVATAEGAIAELVNHSPYNIDGAKILVTGYGNCGRTVAEKLQSLGARVTILARRREVRRQAKKDGFYAVDFAFGPEEAMGAAMVVNTVPAPVITDIIIKELPRDAYILDIASKPGGTDFECAREYGIRADLVLGIPGKYAPKESAYILARAIERFTLRESMLVKSEEGNR